MMSCCLHWAADVSSLRTMDGKQKIEWAFQMAADRRGVVMKSDSRDW